MNIFGRHEKEKLVSGADSKVRVAFRTIDRCTHISYYEELYAMFLDGKIIDYSIECYYNNSLTTIFNKISEYVVVAWLTNDTCMDEKFKGKYNLDKDFKVSDKKIFSSITGTDNKKLTVQIQNKLPHPESLGSIVYDGEMRYFEDIACLITEDCNENICFMNCIINNIKASNANDTTYSNITFCNCYITNVKLVNCELSCCTLRNVILDNCQNKFGRDYGRVIDITDK